MTIEKSMYERSERIFYYILIAIMTISVLLADIYCVKKMTDEAHTDNLFLFSCIMLTIVLLWLYYRLYKYRILTSKVIFDEKGVRYISKVAVYYIPWEKIGRVRLGAWGNSVACIFFLDDNKNTRYFNDAKLISNSMIFLFYNNEIYEFVKMHWHREIVDKTGVLDTQAKKEARKQKRLDKKQKKSG